MAACSSCGAPLPGGARFCPNCAAPVVEERPSEERKLATVLFADLVGSTETAGDQDAERTRALLTRFYDAMAAEIAEAGGTIEKFIGDAVEREGVRLAASTSMSWNRQWRASARRLAPR